MMLGMERTHSPACRSIRSEAQCNCEANLVDRLVKVRCVCGNRWTELGLHDYDLGDCACAFPGDEEEVPDDSFKGGSREHQYNVDRL